LLSDPLSSAELEKRVFRRSHDEGETLRFKESQRVRERAIGGSNKSLGLSS
ncbi:hypothetical protein HAX54_014826, partial [Datura stramonium]|nr:hypothetical protein [Datura stramonium]